MYLILLNSMTIDLSPDLRKRKDGHGPPLLHKVTLTAKPLVHFDLFSLYVSLSTERTVFESFSHAFGG